MLKIKANAISALLSGENCFGKRVLEFLNAAQSGDSVHREHQKVHNKAKLGGCRIIWGKAVSR